MVTENAFRGIARGHPDWLAQGLFLHALDTEEELRRLLIERLDLDVPPGTRPTCAEEVGGEGWRADVRVEWRPGVDTRFELELGEGTPRPGEAEDAERIDAVIGPAGIRAPGPRAKALSWHELAATVRDPVVAALLRQAAADESWALEELDRPELCAELATWRDSHGATPPRRIHRFLSTVDHHLHRIAGERYRPASTWSGSPTSEPPHHGFAFELVGERARTRRWLGFAGECGTVDLRLSPPWSPEEPVLRFAAFPLEAAGIARVIAGLC